MTVTDLIMHDLRCGNITVEKALKLIFREANRMLYVIPKKMKNKIVIEGEEFELPDDLVMNIKERFKERFKEEIESITYSDIIDKMRKESVVPEREFKIGYFKVDGKHKIQAILKIINTARYLNKEWVPNWLDVNEDKFYIYINSDKVMQVGATIRNKTFIYFKTKELAMKAIDILGEYVIKQALITDF